MNDTIKYTTLLGVLASKDKADLELVITILANNPIDLKQGQCKDFFIRLDNVIAKTSKFPELKSYSNGGTWTYATINGRTKASYTSNQKKDPTLDKLYTESVINKPLSHKDRLKIYCQCICQIWNRE